MVQFSLIQTGEFITSPSANPFRIKSFISNIEFDYMASSEFKRSSLQAAYTRLMYNYSKYVKVQTGIFINPYEELVLFCFKEHVDTIINMLKEYISNPYELTGAISPQMNSNAFWWCIDNEILYGDWMACSSKKWDILNASLEESESTWMLIPANERQRLYSHSIM